MPFFHHFPGHFYWKTRTIRQGSRIAIRKWRIAIKSGNWNANNIIQTNILYCEVTFLLMYTAIFNLQFCVNCYVRQFLSASKTQFNEIAEIGRSKLIWRFRTNIKRSRHCNEISEVSISYKRRYVDANAANRCRSTATRTWVRVLPLCLKTDISSCSVLPN